MNETESLDALLPAQIARKAEDIGVAKGNMDALSMFLLAVLAGAFIAMGAVFSTTAVTGADSLPWGVTRVLAGLTFCLGLILVVIAGAELFTGNNLLVMAFVSGKLPARKLLRNWTIVYVGNFCGSVATAGLMFASGQYKMLDGELGVIALNIAQSKCTLLPMEALVRGIYCNALVCLAIWLCFSARTTTGKIAAILFPITAFVAAGFEHSVANMYFIPIGLFIKSGAPAAYWQTIDGSTVAVDQITWAGFMLGNLLPVTIGNIIGGSGFVGVIYWIIYARKADPR
ncbi:MAG: formate/nitrite transporter family protein [Phycisphaeraceae bacterium]